MDFVRSYFFPNATLTSWTFLDHFCHHFWVGLVLLCCRTHPKVMTKMAKKCSTDKYVLNLISSLFRSFSELVLPLQQRTHQNLYPGLVTCLASTVWYILAPSDKTNYNTITDIIIKKNIYLLLTCRKYALISNATSQNLFIWIL